MIEFFTEAIREAPVAVGALVGFALAPIAYLAILRPLDRRHERKFQKKLDRIMGRTDDEGDA